MILPLLATIAAGSSFDCTPYRIWDGDTLTCRGGRKVRLSAISAREVKRVGSRIVDNGCGKGHPCAEMNGLEARNKLARIVGEPVGQAKSGHMLVRGYQLQCHSSGSGGRDRTAAFCWRTDGVQVNCAMVQAGAAVRWVAYDKQRRLCR